MKTQAFFPSPEDCARAFYEAFERTDVDEMMSVWAEDEEVCCVHPSAAPLYGFAAVRTSWENIFQNNARMRIELRDERWHTTIGMVCHQAVQWVYVGEEPQPRGPVFITNIFLRAPQGWRLLSHHASPLQTGLGNTSGPVVLH